MPGNVIRDSYEYFVVDNSNDAEASKTIESYCSSNRINYTRLPKNPGLDGSLSHGFALNWTYRNMVQAIKPRRFGFIDHDLFPFQPVRIGDYLDLNDSWGSLIINYRPFWHFWGYLYAIWAGLCFFRTERFAGQDPNFLPFLGLDTGGRIRVDAKTMFAVPDVCDLPNSPLREVEPNVFIGMYGKFVHFGSSPQSQGFDAQKRWIKSFLTRDQRKIPNVAEKSEK